MLQPSAFGPQPTVLAQGGLFAKQKRIQTNIHMQHIPPKGLVDTGGRETAATTTTSEHETYITTNQKAHYFSPENRIQVFFVFGLVWATTDPWSAVALDRRLRLWDAATPSCQHSSEPVASLDHPRARYPLFFREYLPPAFVFSCKTRKLIREETGQCGGRC